MLTIWQACAQRCAGARERVCLPARAQRCVGARERVCLPFGRRARSALRVHVSGCARARAGVLTIWQACAQRSAVARERMCLPFGRRARSADVYRAALCVCDAKKHCDLRCFRARDKNLLVFAAFSARAAREERKGARTPQIPMCLACETQNPAICSAF